MTSLLVADIRLISESPLTVDNSFVNGDDTPLLRNSEPEQVDVDPANAKNLLFGGSKIVDGEGLGIVVATGRHTYMGSSLVVKSSSGCSVM